MDLSELNNKQQQAVLAPLGPVLVLAGPGSGKTKTLTHRIAYIIEKRLVHPEAILALTFTNRASKEMRERVGKLLSRLPGASEKLVMGTFHSVCARFLRSEIRALGYGPDFVIYDDDDQNKLIKDICEDLRQDTKKFPASLIRALISRSKNLMQTPQEFDLGLKNPLHQIVRDTYERYQDGLFKQNGLDFDDLLFLTVKLFESFPQILKKFQKRFSYILVDEYQDTNPVQYRLLRLLATHRSLFVVGDDAQSIYRFRGSDIRNILNFEKDYPDSLVIKLEQNYRSSQNILHGAQKVIEMNSEQKEKTLWTENAPGEKITLYTAGDERMEAEFVAKKIIQLSSPQNKEQEYTREETGFGSILDRVLKARKIYGDRYGFSGASTLPQLPKNHHSLKEYCVLYRTHAQSRQIEEVFMQTGIPYQIVGGLKFYQRKEIKDALAYLRVVMNFKDLVSLKRIINEPTRGIGDKSYQLIRDAILELPEKQQTLGNLRKNIANLDLGQKAKQSAQDFFSQLAELSALNKDTALTQVLKTVLIRTGYKKFLQDGSEIGQSRWENIEELFNVTAKFQKLGWQEGAIKLLEEVALMSEIDSKDDHKDAVIMMTLHSAKGLEFDNVFFVGLEEGILPHSRSLMEPEELAEEIRLAYVGLTRARKRLFLLYARARRIYGENRISTPSRILKALPKELLDIQGESSVFSRQDEGKELVVEEMEF